MFTQLLMYMNTNQIVTKHGKTGSLTYLRAKNSSRRKTPSRSTTC